MAVALAFEADGEVVFAFHGALVAVAFEVAAVSAGGGVAAISLSAVSFHVGDELAAVEADKPPVEVVEPPAFNLVSGDGVNEEFGEKLEGFTL
jgi:hypothetical protein